MRNRLISSALPGLVALAATACGDSATEPLALALSQSSRAVSLRDDSLRTLDDSVSVLLTGGGAAQTSWTATHGAGAWLTVLTASGVGPGQVRWRRDPTVLPPLGPSGDTTYIDTITVTVTGAPPVRILDSLQLRTAPAEFITVRRPWLPGERDATIQRYLTDRPFVVPLAGDVTDHVIQTLHPDSVTEVVANPAFGAAGPVGPMRAARFASTWDISGIDVLLVDQNSVPRDTVHWIGVFWSNPAEVAWKGFVVAARPSGVTTVPQTSVRTNTFDAGGGKSGVGGGESRATTGQYWEANGTGAAPNNTIVVTAASYGGTTTITTGPFLGGTAAGGFMFGRLRTIVMPLAAGTGLPASITVDFNFSAGAIGALRLVCDFPSPCTSNTLRAPSVRWGRP